MKKSWLKLAVWALFPFFAGAGQAQVVVKAAPPAVVVPAPVAPAPQVVLMQPPPPRLHEIIGRSPGPAYAWVPGYWTWQGRWVWISGAWQLRPFPRAVWVAGRWGHHAHRYTWVAGHWK